MTTASPDDPAGPLVVRAGDVLVATDGLLAHLDVLGRLDDDLDRIAARLAALDADADWRRLPGVSSSAAATEARLDELRAAVRDAAGRTGDIRHGVRVALGAYRSAEALVAQATESVQGLWAAGIGFWLHAAAPATVLIASLATLTLDSAWLAMPGRDATGKAAWLRGAVAANPRLVTSPGFVAAVRAVARHLDATALAAAGLPVPLAALAGDERLGGRGAGGNARGVLALAGGAGLLRESEVRVERRGAVRGDPAPPAGAADRLARVPEGDQVRIERYDAPGRPPRFVVYVAPTETFTPLPTGEPWDLASNVAGVAGLSAGSFRATELAMHDAGVTAASEVQFVGFSQGGLVAAMLAGSGHWTAVGLETYGAPSGGTELPAGIAGVDVRHADDLVPALAGADAPSDRIRVEREAFATGEPPHDLVVPAHQRVTYQATAEAVDAARSAAVRDQLATMRAFTEEYASAPGSTMTVLGYHAERVWPTGSESPDAGVSASGRAAGDAPRGR